MYTQCPSCRTLFRISEQQLAAAKGKVRCGKCNHIYNAQGTLIDELPQQTAATPVTKPKVEPQPAAATPQLHEFENFDIPKPSSEQVADDKPLDNSWQEPDFNIITAPPSPSTIDVDDDLQNVELNTDISDINSSEDDEDDWLFSDDETEIPSVSHLQQNIDADDVQMVNLGSDSSFTSEIDIDDDEDDWLFNDNTDLPDEADVDIVLNDEGKDTDSAVDIVLRDENEFIPETTPTPEPEPAPIINSSPDDETDEEDSDFMHHMSDYLDDDAADELISDESAANILSEVNEQLSLSMENPETEETQSTQGINLPGDWADDFEEAINSDNELSDEEKEKQELNEAILKGLEMPAESTPEPAKVNAEPATAGLSMESSSSDHFQAGESIILEAAEDPDTGHKIGQHDKVPLRIRDSVGIEAAEPRSGLKWLTITGSVLALILVLAIQLVMFRSIDIAGMYPNLQPTLVKLCESLPCRDSRPLDIDQIRLLSRNISQHPKVKSALLIKAAIINRANFAQRYPKIQITLSDVTGDTVAQRIFYPQEYLGSLYHPFLTMKPATPIHIALEVMDPGSAAINFEFQFL